MPIGEFDEETEFIPGNHFHNTIFIEILYCFFFFALFLIVVVVVAVLLRDIVPLLVVLFLVSLAIKWLLQEMGGVFRLAPVS